MTNSSRASFSRSLSSFPCVTLSLSLFSYGKTWDDPLYKPSWNRSLAQVVRQRRTVRTDLSLYLSFVSVLVCDRGSVAIIIFWGTYLWTIEFLPVLNFLVNISQYMFVWHSDFATYYLKLMFKKDHQILYH